MRLWTLLLLVLLVGGLVWLRGRRDEERATGGVVPVERPLLPGLEAGAVDRIRVEHLERGVEYLLERDDYGRWHLTEPLAYPAEDALVTTLLRYLRGATGRVLGEPDRAALGLAPPRVVVQLREGAAEDGGEPRSWRLELGAVDLDARRVYARVPGHPDAPPGADALTTLVVRSIDTTLDRNPDDFRDTRIATLAPGKVAELVRGGTQDPGAYFELFRDGPLWRRRDDPRVSMDPTAVDVVLRAVTSLRAHRFVDDAPTDLSPYGLDEPRLELQLVGADGRRELILLSTAPREPATDTRQQRWFALRHGSPHVFEVRGNDVVLLLTPTEMLYDYAVVRTVEQDVHGVALTTSTPDGREVGLALERFDDGWWVEELGVDAPRRRRADADAAGSVVAALVQAELGEYAPPGTFEPGDSPRHLEVRVASGSGAEATIGATWRDPRTGSEGPLYRRAGEGVAATTPDGLSALFDLTLEDLEDRLIHGVDEIDVNRIEVRHGDAVHAYRRVERQWRVGERDVVSGERAVLLERLLRLEAERWLDDAGQALVDPVYVSMAGTRTLAFTLGRLPDGRLAVDTPDRRAVLAADPLQTDVHSALLETFR